MEKVIEVHVELYIYIYIYIYIYRERERERYVCVCVCVCVCMCVCVCRKIDDDNSFLTLGTFLFKPKLCSFFFSGPALLLISFL